MDSTLKPKISIVIPVYPMENGEFFLRRSLLQLTLQTFKSFEVVITDNSDDDRYEKLIKDFPTLNFYYAKENRRGMAANTNASIRASQGELIKILYQDDCLAHEKALETIVGQMTGLWLITGCDTNPNPHWTSNILEGNNKLGSPSVLTFKNKSFIHWKNTEALMFDESLKWLLDCDYYHRLYEIYGAPQIINGVQVIMGVGDHQQTAILSDFTKLKEQEYLLEKYAQS